MPVWWECGERWWLWWNLWWIRHEKFAFVNGLECLAPEWKWIVDLTVETRWNLWRFSNMQQVLWPTIVSPIDPWTCLWHKFCILHNFVSQLFDRKLQSSLKTSFNCTNCCWSVHCLQNLMENKKTVLGCFVLTSVKDIDKLSHFEVTCRPFLKVHMSFWDFRKFFLCANKFPRNAEALWKKSGYGERKRIVFITGLKRLGRRKLKQKRV